MKKNLFEKQEEMKDRAFLKDNEKIAKIVYNEGTRKERHEYRLKLIERLGGKCVRCGFVDPRALQFDHKDGGGRAESRALGQYWMLKKIEAELDNYPISYCSYQLLCANCNWIKRVERSETRKKISIEESVGDNYDNLFDRVKKLPTDLNIKRLQRPRKP